MPGQRGCRPGRRQGQGQAGGAETPVLKTSRRRAPTPSRTSRQTRRGSRRPEGLSPSLVAEVLTADLLVVVLSHLSMQDLHRVALVNHTFCEALGTSVSLRHALRPTVTKVREPEHASRVQTTTVLTCSPAPSRRGTEF